MTGASSRVVASHPTHMSWLPASWAISHPAGDWYRRPTVAASTHPRPADVGPADLEVTMTNQLAFAPDTLRILPGETVVWRNTSDVIHTVTADPGKVVDRLEHRDEVVALTRLDAGQVCPGEPGYPVQLLDLPDPPACLFVVGKSPAAAPATVAIVGARTQ